MPPKSNAAIKRYTELQAKLKREYRPEFRHELNRIAELLKSFKRVIGKLERATELRAAAYMLEKETSERALIYECQKAMDCMLAKEQQVLKLTQKIVESNISNQRANLAIKHEAIERAYRRREGRAAERRYKLEKDIADAREKQHQETQYMKALQIARSEREFKEMIERLKVEEMKLNEDIELQRKLQIVDEDFERLRLLDFEPYRTMVCLKSERKHHANIRAIIAAKLKTMRDACLPEKCIREAEKHMQHIALPINVMVPLKSWVNPKI